MGRLQGVEGSSLESRGHGLEWNLDLIRIRCLSVRTWTAEVKKALEQAFHSDDRLPLTSHTEPSWSTTREGRSFGGDREPRERSFMPGRQKRVEIKNGCLARVRFSEPCPERRLCLTQDASLNRDPVVRNSCAGPSCPSVSVYSRYDVVVPTRLMRSMFMQPQISHRPSCRRLNFGFNMLLLPTVTIATRHRPRTKLPAGQATALRSRQMVLQMFSISPSQSKNHRDSDVED